MPRPGVDGKTIFNEDARLYARARPGYPEEIIEEVIAYSGILKGGRILEIGCGPGQATYPFARRGYRMLCVEPGPNMVEVNRERTHGCSVEYAVSSFEDWPVEERAFDMALAASSFHWIPEEIGFPKVAQALKDHGAFALLRNKHPRPYSAIFNKMTEAYRVHSPELAATESEDDAQRFENGILDFTKKIEDTGLFEDVTTKRLAWSKEFTAQGYVDLMNTYSGHRALPEDRKQALYADICRIIEENGGTVVRGYLTVAYLARKK